MKRERLRGLTRAMARGGEGVVETERGVVLVAGALLGDEVQLTLTPSRRGAQRGQLTQLLTPGSGRRDSPCALSARCGGCPLIALDEETQGAIKRGFLAEAIRKGGGEEGRLEWRPARPIRYRRRARLAWRRAGERIEIGYRALQDTRVVDVEECLVLSALLQEALRSLRGALGPHLQGEGEVHLGEARQLPGAPGGDQAVLQLTTEDPQPQALYEAAAALVEAHAIRGVSLRCGGAIARFGAPEERFVHADGAPFVLPEFGFSQAHLESAQLAIAVAQACEGMRSVCEYYAGSGYLSALIAANVSSLICVESVASAVDALRQNLTLRGLKAKAICADAAQPPKAVLNHRAECVVLDPPRAGAREVCEAITAGASSRVVYVSCDTATLGRDLQILRGGGFAIQRAIGFDLFPQTAHLESLVVLTRSPK